MEKQMASHPFKMQEAETPLPDHYVYNLSILPGYVLLGENYAVKRFLNTGKAPRVTTNFHAPGECPGCPFPARAPAPPAQSGYVLSRVKHMV